MNHLNLEVIKKALENDRKNLNFGEYLRFDQVEWLIKQVELLEINYINMGKLSELFDTLDRGFEYKITRKDFGEEYKQIAIDIVGFLNKYNRAAKLENGLDYCEIDI